MPINSIFCDKLDTTIDIRVLNTDFIGLCSPLDRTFNRLKWDCPHTMRNRNISWVGSISEELEEKGPICFTLYRLRKQDHLFAHRSALFYTPTENIPSELVGSGSLDVLLPIASPDYTDFQEIRAYNIPRFWVDLIQRQTHKVRL